MDQSALPILLAAAVAVGFLFIARRVVVLGITVTPLLGFYLLRLWARSPILWPALAVLAVVFATCLVAVLRQGILAPAERTRSGIRFWRFVLRPAAMAFPVLLLTIGRTFTLILLGVVTAGFISLDLGRLSAQRVNLFVLRNAARCFKPSEAERVSSMTGFLIASLLIMLLFDPTVALYAMAFLVFGDFFAKYCGLQFGRTRLFNKTVEGSLAHLITCLAAAGVINEFLPVPFWTAVLAALTASLFEALPLDVDDNLTVGITSAAVLHSARLLAR